MKNINVEYRKITADDIVYFKDGVELLNRTQGRDLFSQDYLNLRSNDPNSYVVGAFQDSNLVGLGIAQVISTFDYYIPFDSNISEEIKDKKVGSFSTLCITERLQGNGIGQIISKNRLKWIEEKNCDLILGVSWVSGLAHTSNRVFEKMGFRAVQRVDNFYYQSSIEKPFVCPGCGEPPCTCSAILYRKDL